MRIERKFQDAYVSTHSRPKAAARSGAAVGQGVGFNTQPPEGGWSKSQTVI